MCHVPVSGQLPTEASVDDNRANGLMRLLGRILCSPASTVKASPPDCAAGSRIGVHAVPCRDSASARVTRNRAEGRGLHSAIRLQGRPFDQW